MRYLKLFLLITPVILFFDCSNNEFDTDISDVELHPVTFKRMYKEDFNADTINLKEHILSMKKKYGPFYNQFYGSILEGSGNNDSVFSNQFKGFIRDRDMRMIFNLINSKYDDKFIRETEESTTQVFKRAKKLFPDTMLPKQFVLFYSGLNYRNINVDSTIGIGLEFYLGGDSKIYDMISQPVPSYKKRLMEKEYIIRDMVMSWVLFKFDQNQPESNLLETMMEAGRFFYCTKRLLPDMHDSVLFGYNSKQMEYCEKYEKDIWKFFSEKNRLYLNDMKEIISYNTEGPFTAAISKDCPPAIARYIGYRIICSYMKNNNEVRLADLMSNANSQKLMTKSKYKP